MPEVRIRFGPFDGPFSGNAGFYDFFTESGSGYVEREFECRFHQHLRSILTGTDWMARGYTVAAHILDTVRGAIDTDVTRYVVFCMGGKFGQFYAF